MGPVISPASHLHHGQNWNWCGQNWKLTWVRCAMVVTRAVFHDPMLESSGVEGIRAVEHAPGPLKYSHRKPARGTFILLT
jgi:hypothetical protein